MLNQLLLRINLLLEEADQKCFERMVISLEDWGKDLSCLCTRGFAEASSLYLKGEKDLVKAKRLLRKYKKQIRKQIAINDQK
ncbi:MAG: hypothetical protein WC895_04555 [Candidatus Shapirobacteria bacterium]|jgi:hypothetical protein